MGTIQKEVENGTAFLKLNRPEVFNSFNREMALELQKELKFCASSDRIRAIVLTGNGKAFCAGQDLQEVAGKKSGLGFRTLLEEHYAPIIKTIRETEKPIIAAVNGVAAGAGANIALACDIVVASDKASFIQAFGKIGLIPDSGGTFFLPRLIGVQKALALMMTGEKINAMEAERLGMIYKVFSWETFQEEYETLAFTLAKMPTKALALTKKAVNASMNNTLNDQLLLETELQIIASETNDYAEGVAAFIQKRPSNFIGS